MPHRCSSTLALAVLLVLLVAAESGVTQSDSARRMQLERHPNGGTVSSILCKSRLTRNCPSWVDCECSQTLRVPVGHCCIDVTWIKESPGLPAACNEAGPITAASGHGPCGYPCGRKLILQYHHRTSRNCALSSAAQQANRRASCVVNVESK